MMAPAEEAVIQYIFDHWGILGLLAAAPAALAYVYHRVRMAELKTQADEQRADKNDYKNVIVGNTEAMTKLCSAVDNCTSSNNQIQTLVQRLNEKIGS